MPSIKLNSGNTGVSFTGTIEEMIAFVKGIQNGDPAPEKVEPRPAAQLLPGRERLIRSAREDVRRLTTQGEHYKGYRCKVEFHVNKEKGAVTALIRRVVTNRVISKGHAKAAPGDVFNESIGRAIALRRALGKLVPAALLNAPKPEGAKAGDIVEYEGNRYTLVNADIPVTKRSAHVGSYIGKHGKLVDDSGEVTA